MQHLKNRKHFKFKIKYNKNQHQHQHQYQQGFTLIELLIALVISGLLVLATWISFSATSRANKTQTGVASVRDQAFYILDRVEYMIKHAGFTDYRAVSTLNLNNLYSGGAQTNKIAAFNNQGDNNSTNFNNNSDSLAVEFQVPNFDAGQEMLGCSGATLAAGVPEELFLLRMYTNGTNLMCEVRRSGTLVQGPSVVAQNVQRFKVFYRNLEKINGQDTCTAGWQQANQMGGNYSQVCGLYVAFLSTSPAQQVQTSGDQTFELAPTTASQKNDTRVVLTPVNNLMPIARITQKNITLKNQ